MGLASKTREFLLEIENTSQLAAWSFNDGSPVFFGISG
jgi:hypothetical protein